MELETPIEEVKVATNVVITAFLNRIEDETIDIEYLLLTADGEPFKRGVVSYRGHDEAKALYAELDEIIATGKSFEDASTELLFNKVLGAING